MKRTIILTLALAGFASQAGAVGASVLCGYTNRARDTHGGHGQVQADIANAFAGANQVHVRSDTWVVWDIAGYHNSGISDQRTGGSILGDVANNTPLRDKARSLGCNLINMTADTTDVGGIAYQPGQHSVVDSQYIHRGYYAHELGHNYSADHNHGLCWSCNGQNNASVMKLNYCGGFDYWGYYTNPGVYTQCRYLGDATHNNALRINDTRWTRATTGF